MRNPVKRAHTLGLLLVAVFGVIAAFASIALAGTKTGLALGLVFTIGPALLYAAITVPIAFPFGLYAAITPFDTLLTVDAFGTVTKVLGIASAAAMLFYIIRTKRTAPVPRATLFWLIFYLWVTSTLWWAIDTDPSFKLLGISWNLLALFFVAAMFRTNPKMLRTAAASVLIGGVVAALYGIYFFHSGANLAHTGGRLWIQTDEAQINPDHFANAFLLPVSLALVGALWARRWTARILYIGALLVMLLAIALTGARGAMVGFAALALFLLIKDRHRIQLALVLIGGSIAALPMAAPLLITRFSMALSTGGAGRVGIWKAGLEALKHYWLLGAGYGNFPLAYDQVYISVFQAIDPHFHRASHNMLLNAAVETGIIGAVLFLLAWLQTFRMLSPIAESDYRYPLRLALQGAIVGLFFAGMFADIMITKYVWLAFMLAAMTYNAVPRQVSRAPARIVTRGEVAASA